MKKKKWNSAYEMGGELSENMTRQELRELETGEKTQMEKVREVCLLCLPAGCFLAALAEYILIPNMCANERPRTYSGFLIVLIVMYLTRLIMAFVKNSRHDAAMMEDMKYRAPRFAAFFLVLAAYDYMTLKTGILRQPFVPCLNAILNIAWIDRGYLIKSTLHTLRLLNLGYFAGVLLGLVTGIVCGYSKKARYWIDPVIKFLGPIPTSTWIPIIMVVATSLFGGAVFIIAMGSWFAVTVASMTGIANVDREYFEAARMLGASEKQLVFRVAIPHAMPSILQGCTQAMSTACTAIMIAEMMGVEAGLGWYMSWAKSWSSYDKMFAALFVICFIFTVVTKILDLIKSHALRWQKGEVK